MSGIIGLCGIVYVFYVVFTHPHTGFTGYIDKTAIILLAIAPPSIMLLSHTIQDFLTGFVILFRSTFQNSRKSQGEVINTLTACSAKVRAEGVGSLMGVRDKLKNELLRDGVSMIVNDFTVQEIRHNLEAKISTKQGHMSLAVNLFENMSKVCPGVGMIATLVGMITMLSNMSDPSTIGAGLAVAMIGTLYGLILGTIIYAPFAEKISLESEKILELDMLVMEGVLHLKEKKSSLHFRDLVKTYGSKKGGNAAAEPAARK